MKRIVLLSICLLSLPGFAQQTISDFQGVLPNPDNMDGTTLRLYFRGIPAVPVDESPQGANATWDFSGVNFILDHHDYMNFVPSAQTVAEYPACNFQTSIAEDTPEETANIYADYTNGSYSILKAQGEIMTLDYTVNTAFIGQFPMDYGYLNSDVTAGNFTYNGTLGAFQGTFAGTVDSYFDAYGTLNYMSDDGQVSSVNVSRLKVTQITSLSIPFFPDAGTLSEVSYYYYAQNEFGIWPFVRSIQTNLTVPLFDIDQSMLVLEKATDAVLGMPTETSVSIAVYPNPASDIIKVKALNEVRSIEILSIDGKRIQKSYGDSANISQLSKGSYLASIETQAGIVYRKFVKN